MGFQQMPLQHNLGMVSLENLDYFQTALPLSPTHDLGIQIGNDGRVWICVDGVALLRFKPVQSERG